MIPKLPSCLSKYLFLLLAFFFGITAQNSYAQTILSAGDLVVVTVNADDPKNFDFIPLVDLQTGTVIHFTDDAWESDSAAFRGGEGIITFTAPDLIPAGTVVSFDASFTNGFTETGDGYNPSGSGDNLLVYQGNQTDPTFIYGVGWAQGDSWEYADGSTNESDIPPGLSEANYTILSLGTANNLQYDAAKGIKGTKDFLLALVGDETNWIENDSQSFSAFPANFELVDPPTIAFATAFITVNEGDGSIPVNVKLVESNDTSVSVDVSFIASSSSAVSADIGNYSSQPVNFSSADASGTIKTIAVNLNDDSQYLGKKIAVFELRNISTGTLLTPGVLTVEIEDNDAPKVVINEILADPGTIDANNDGIADGGDEFVEIVNRQSAGIDISGWTFADGDPGSPTPQYTFPAGTVIPPNDALVLFEGQPSGYYGGAIIQTTDESIALTNSGETLFIQDEKGNIIDQIFYGESLPGESFVRATDSTLANHSTMPGAEGFLISPGIKADGSAFGGGYSVGVRGGEGWRMISSATQNTSFADLLAPYWMQGITGSDAPSDTMPNIYKWNEALGGFQDVPASMSDEMRAGTGYIVYFFADDQPAASMPGIQGGFPKILTSDKDENTGTVQVNISVTDRNGNNIIDSNEGWNLLGNPFATDISVQAVKNALSTVGDSLNANVYIWNHAQGGGNGGYEILDNDDTIAPFQAFFVKYMGSSEVNNATVNFNRNELAANKGTRFYKEINTSAFQFSIELHDEQYFDTYSLEFGEQGNIELDRFDAIKQFSLSPNSISLYSRAGDYRLQKNELPVDLQTTLEIPLSFKASGRSSLTFQWNNIEKIPADWQIVLIDNEINREIDLSVAESYQFDIFRRSSKLSNHPKEKSLLNKQWFNEETPRFVLSIRPPQRLALNEENLSIQLKPNFPNPFTSSTTVPFELAQDADVTLTIWNMIGQKVATLVDGVQEAGIHDDINWNASDMPSGIYIARLEVAGQVFIRKMTLIK